MTRDVECFVVGTCDVACGGSDYWWLPSDDESVSSGDCRDLCGDYFEPSYLDVVYCHVRRVQFRDARSWMPRWVHLAKTARCAASMIVRP